MWGEGVRRDENGAVFELDMFCFTYFYFNTKAGAGDYIN